MNVMQKLKRENSISAFTEDALSTDDAVAMANKLSNGEVSSEALVEAAIARLGKVNGRLNAVAVEAFDQARVESKTPRSGILSGLPTFIKDTDEVAGLPLYLGSAALPGAVSEASSNIVEAIDQTGMVKLGTSTTPEFGLTGTTENVRFGATRNPWNTDYSTGGSSGGSSALVAAGVVPMAHANDGAGSIRIPASCCGLVGLKPSRGRLPAKDVPNWVPVNIFHEGVVTRTVRDTIAFYNAVENAGVPSDFPPIGEVGDGRIGPLRIAVLVENCHGVECDSQNVLAARNAARLCEKLGHEVEFISNPFSNDFDDFFWIFWSLVPLTLKYFGKSFFKEFDYEKTQGLFKYLAKVGLKNIFRIPWAFRQAKAFVEEYNRFMNQYDILLTPTLGTPTPKIGYLGPEVSGEMHLDRIKPFVPFTKYQNISGAPAITLPLAQCLNGLPIGVQFAAKMGEDRQLLKLALDIEKEAPWQTLADLPGEDRRP